MGNLHEPVELKRKKPPKKKKKVLDTTSSGLIAHYASYNHFLSAYHSGPSGARHIPAHGGTTVLTKTPRMTNLTVDDWTGTLGGIVIDRTTKQQYLLSNQHVFFDDEDDPAGANIGNKILQIPDFNQIGTTVKYGNMKVVEAKLFSFSTSDATAISQSQDYCDAGLATPTATTSFELNRIGIQRAAIAPVNGMKVTMFGATSGLVNGVITDAHFNHFWGDSKTKTFTLDKNVIRCAIKGDYGDSGSPLVETGTGRFVGIDYSGPDNQDVEDFIPAVTIEKYFNVVFAPEELVTTPAPTPTPTPIPIPIPPVPGGPPPTTIPANPFQSFIQWILDFLTKLFGINIMLTPAAAYGRII